ncbi:MAG TPA: EAL domain-containing protein [Blastocatellia bacterium]|nr:EAL domain-containing protein [Blastocatellia bacterium]
MGKPQESLFQRYNETDRLVALNQYQITYNEPEECFDSLTQLAAQICQTSIARLSFIDSERVRHKSEIGSAEIDCLRENSFYNVVIAAANLVIISDTAQDERSANLCAADCGIRFYAGVPLITPRGQVVGTLSVLDHQPRELITEQIQALRTLAESAMAQLELKRKNRELEAIIDEREQLIDAREIDARLLVRIERHSANLMQTLTTVKEERVARERQLASIVADKERYELAVRCSNDALFDWNLKTNEVYYSPRWKSLLGCAENDIGDSPDEWFDRAHPEDIELLRVEIEANLIGWTAQLQNEHRIQHSDGTYRWVLVRAMIAFDANSERERMIGLFTDITERKEAEQYMLEHAFHDPLTKLPNRALFIDRLERSLSRLRRCPDYLFAVLFIDLDRFKVINDSLGHQIGDELLVGIARRLENCLRPGDMVARLGGDEFAVILDQLHQESDAAATAERLQEKLSAPFIIQDREIFASASIGIALSQIPYERAEDFLRGADTAMDRAKTRGRGSFEVFDTEMHTRVAAQLQLETDLRRAITRKEFRLCYQPIINLNSRQVVGFEVLLRWPHPEQGLIPPTRFIPIAEETGLILPISQWVLREACQQMRQWQIQIPSQQSLTISVNLSGKQFSQPDLIDYIKQVLAETGLDASCLKLEITETALIDNPEAAIVMLSQLKDLGIHISLDDFGTGYSSLSYLHRFPIDTIKVDRSFISRINRPKDSEIVRTIVALAENLGLDVVAEGVETDEQADQLVEMHCKYGQGYLFSKPVNEDLAREMVGKVLVGENQEHLTAA